MIVNSTGKIEELRKAIRRIEAGGVVHERRVASLGAGIDAALPWGGLPFAGLHEVQGRGLHGFAAALSGCFLKACGGGLVWCQDVGQAASSGEIYGPALAAFGIDHGRFLLVRAKGDDLLWALEEVLRCPAVAVAVAEVQRLDLQASRRLQLAAEKGGAAGLLIRPPMAGAADRNDLDQGHNAALTRWYLQPQARLDALRGDASRGDVWRADLWRVKGGAPHLWEMSWDERTFSFTATSGLADRAALSLDQAAGPSKRSAKSG